MWFGLGLVPGLPSGAGPLCFQQADITTPNLVTFLTARRIYSVVNLAEKVVGAAGIEPATPTV